MRFIWLVFLAFLCSCCLTKPPAKAPSAPPRVTWAMANEYLWTEEEQAVVRTAVNDINAACGRELLHENRHTPAITLHTKKLAFFEAELFFQGGILGLADPETRSAAFYPLAFERPDVLRSTVIHEIGHLLGMRHTDYPDSIMRPQLAGGEGMSWYDVRVLNTFGWACVEK